MYGLTVLRRVRVSRIRIANCGLAERVVTAVPLLPATLVPRLLPMIGQSEAGKADDHPDGTTTWYRSVSGVAESLADQPFHNCTGQGFRILLNGVEVNIRGLRGFVG